MTENRRRNETWNERSHKVKGWDPDLERLPCYTLAGSAAFIILWDCRITQCIAGLAWRAPVVTWEYEILKTKTLSLTSMLNRNWWKDQHLQPGSFTMALKRKEHKRKTSVCEWVSLSPLIGVPYAPYWPWNLYKINHLLFDAIDYLMQLIIWHNWLFNWSIDWSIDRSTDRLIDWLIDWNIYLD